MRIKRTNKFQGFFFYISSQMKKETILLFPVCVFKIDIHFLEQNIGITLL